MARPTTKAGLIAAAETEFARLLELVHALDPAIRSRPGACDDWSAKDLLAHLDAWNRMFLAWEEAGRRGEVVPKPAEGFTWAETPALNARIHAETADDAWDEVRVRLAESHARVISVIEGYRDEDLFTKKRYPWTGSTSVALYAGSATASHYAWARRLVEQWCKRIGGRGPEESS
jgi:hypothetical protein